MLHTDKDYNLLFKINQNYCEQIGEKNLAISRLQERRKEMQEEATRLKQELQEAKDLLEKLNKLTEDKELFEGNILKEQIENFLEKT